MTNSELRELMISDRDDVVTEYRGKGNHDIYVDGEYVGTYWFGG